MTTVEFNRNVIAGINAMLASIEGITLDSDIFAVATARTETMEVDISMWKGIDGFYATISATPREFYWQDGTSELENTFSCAERFTRIPVDEVFILKNPQGKEIEGRILLSGDKLTEFIFVD